jgi:hypothetical protein
MRAGGESRARDTGMARLRLALLAAGAVVAIGTACVIAYGASRITTEQSAYQGAPGPPCIPAKLNGSALLPGTSLAVSPLPDSLDASPATQISLLGVPVAQLQGLRVSGSRSGTHTGHLVGFSQGDGASFLSSKPYTTGETVTVRGRAAAQRFAFHFVIADQDPVAHQPPGLEPAGNAKQVQSFYSRPDLKPPTVTVTTSSPQASPGYVFSAPYSGPGQDGPMIFDNEGQVVWFDPLPNGIEATNLQVEQYEGKPVLTWWQGYIPPQGFGEGEEVIANSAYQTIDRVHAGNGYHVDLHDFHLAANDTALLTAFDVIHCNLTSVGGPRDGAVTDGVFQELDMRTHLVRREWHSLNFVALSDSHSDVSGATVTWPYDYFHINSVTSDADGTTLVSARNTWAVYKLDSRTGQILWTLGGKHSSFHMGAGTSTAYQHDARELPDGTFTILDNGGVPKVHPQSRAIKLSLNLQSKTATLLTEYEHSPPLSTGSQANFQTLPNGNVFIGWELPYFSEYTASGQLLFDAHLHGANESYRAYRFGWSGTPSGAPAVAARAQSPGGPVDVYASWNGATEVESWTVLGGPSPAQLAPVASAARSGFETAIPTSAAAPYLAVQALSAAGTVLGTSKAIKAQRG